MHRWIEIAEPGGEEPDEPAPEVTLTAAVESEDAEPGGDEDRADAEPDAVEVEQASARDDSDDGAPMGLAILGVVLGGLGLATGGASLIRAGRR